VISLELSSRIWLHEDVGTFDGSYSAVVPSHGTVLLKIGTPKNGD
jgi:hypothetical protein